MTTHVVTTEAHWAATAPGGGVLSVNGKTGTVVLDAEDVGADPAGAAAFVALDTVHIAEKGAALGVATLDANGNVLFEQLGNAPGGGGGGAVASVNGLTGAVDLSPDTVIHGFTRVDPLKTVATNAPQPLTITTPDGSGQVVEPSFEYVSNGWNGHKWWAMITGYTNGAPATENPAIYYSDDGVSFSPVPGARFPLVDAPPNAPTGTNADPDIRLGPDGVMRSTYMVYNYPVGKSSVYLLSSTNGRDWDGPTLLFQSNTSTEIVTGPMILFDKPNNRWIMWYTDANPNVLPFRFKRRTCAGTDPSSGWSAATICTMNGTPPGKYCWEGHVERRGDQLHMVLTFTTGGGANTTLHFGVSNDLGLTWTFNPTPLLDKSISGWDNERVYRGDIVPVDDGGSGLYGLWYSAGSQSSVWRMGYTTISIQ